MHSVQKETTKRIECLPAIEMVILGLISILIVQCFRAESHRWLAALWLETLFFLLVPVIALGFVHFLIGKSPTRIRIIDWLHGGAGLMILMALVSQWLNRTLGIGDPYELIALTTLVYTAWYLAVFSAFGGFARAAFALNGSLVMFICFMSEQRVVFLLSFVFAVAALWWMLGAYWNRINNKLLDGQSTKLPVNGLAVGGTIILATAAGFIAWMVVPNQSAVKFGGFSFFSGGESGFDDLFARSGVGDGQMLTGGENATTTGPVDSDQFIEDDKPSIYDTTTDQYDGPLIKKKRQHRAVALEAMTRHLHDVVQSESVGKSFRTVREPGGTKTSELEDRITDALFFVEGSVPARFTVDCFHHFDGWDWSKVDLDSEDFVQPTISVDNTGSKPWYVIQRIERNYFTSRRAHRVKMMRLGTHNLPATNLMQCWHIHRVEDPSLFYWNSDGLVRMAGELIPTHTVIDMLSYVPNYHELRSDRNFQLNDHPHPAWEMVDRLLGVGTRSGTSVGSRPTGVHKADSPLLQLPDNKTTSRVISLAKELTEGKRPGWNQVESIVNHLRNQFEHDVARTPNPECEDSVGEFLDNGGGPAYLFATTATQLLRAAGYRTRLASGFVVQAEDYDRTSDQSVVTEKNVHMWPEVSLDGWYWIPVEPTPGFDIPYSHQTWWQWTKSKVSSCLIGMWNRPLTTVLGFIIVIGTVRLRRDIVAGVFWLVWGAGVCLMPSRRLKLTRQLIDTWFWAAGLPRPVFVSTKKWSSQVDAAAGQTFFQYWWIDNFSNQPGAFSSHEVLAACRQIVSDLSFFRIKSFARTPPAQGKS